MIKTIRSVLFLLGISYLGGAGATAAFLTLELAGGIEIFDYHSGNCDSSFITATKILLIINYILWGFGFFLQCLICLKPEKCILCPANKT